MYADPKDSLRNIVRARLNDADDKRLEDAANQQHMQKSTLAHRMLVKALDELDQQTSELIKLLKD